MTIDLPANLVQTLKLRAAYEKCKLKDMAATLIVLGLTVETTKESHQSKLKLPLFKCAQNAPAKLANVNEILAMDQSIILQEDLKYLDIPI